MRVHPTLRAATRLTPRMVVFQIKRSIRGKLVPRFPRVYDRTIRLTASRLPKPEFSYQMPPDVAQFVGAYYRHNDEELNDAACGRFTLLGRTVDFGSIQDIDWLFLHPDEGDGLWRMKFAQLSILHSLISSANEAHHYSARALLQRFEEFRSFESTEAFATCWSPYDTSHRILATLSGLAIARMRGHIEEDVRAEIEDFIRLDAGFLWRNVEHEMRNNHTERNLAALCFYHLAANSISPSRARRLDREVDRIISATVLADGMQVERSAMYQGLTVMSLRIFAACPFLSVATRDLARKRADAAAGAWMFLTHNDGDIALFNDSWFGEVPQPTAVLDTDKVSLPLSLPHAGYYRLSSGPIEALFDAGEIGPRWNPAHGHPDFLALEVDAFGRRFIVDPGTSQYSPGPQRTYERSGQSHNGPHYQGVETVEYHGRFKVGKFRRAEPLSEVDLSHISIETLGGHIRTSAGVCIRIVCALPSGGLLVIDRWMSSRPAGATNLLIPDSWTIQHRGKAVEARSAEVTTEVVVFQGRLGGLEKRTWARRYFHAEDAVAIMLEPTIGPSGAQELAFGIGVVLQSEVSAVQAEVTNQLTSAIKAGAFTQ